MPLPDRPTVSNYGGEYTGGVGHDILLFPAMVRAEESLNATAVLMDGQSSCFFHPEIPANAVCEVSGRFICHLCKTEWNGQTVSLTALQQMRDKGSLQLENKRIIWDDIACGLSLLPLLMWPLTIITAPVAFSIAVTKWSKGPTSILRRSRWRYSLAIIFSLLQIIGWIALLFLV